MFRKLLTKGIAIAALVALAGCASLTAANKQYPDDPAKAIEEASFADLNNLADLQIRLGDANEQACGNWAKNFAAQIKPIMDAQMAGPLSFAGGSSLLINQVQAALPQIQQTCGAVVANAVAKVMAIRSFGFQLPTLPGVPAVPSMPALPAPKL